MFKDALLQILCTIAGNTEPPEEIQVVTGSISADTDIITPSDASKSINVYAFELASGGATNLNIGFAGASSGSLWRTFLDNTLFTLRSVVSVSPPKAIFKGIPGEVISLDFISGTGTVIYSVAYFET